MGFELINALTSEIGPQVIFSVIEPTLHKKHVIESSL